MEKDELTPGPWEWVFLGNAGNYFLVGNEGNGPVTNSGPDSADGRLKKVAPDLLAALKDIIATCSVRIDDPRCKYFDAARAAIAKAEAANDTA